MLDYLRQTIICVMIAVMRSSYPLATINIDKSFQYRLGLWFINLFSNVIAFFLDVINELITETAFIANLWLAIMEYTENRDWNTDEFRMGGFFGEKRLNFYWI